MSLSAAITSAPASWPRLILGSTSRYRRELLERLRLPFDVMASQVDETPLAAESPAALSLRLAHAKAAAVAQMCADDVVVIGSDQVAELAGQPMGKPGGFERAFAQLRAMSGQSVVFHTSVAVHRPKTGFVAGCHGEVRVRFRALSDRDITTYLRLDEPYDCAGSARCETLGIALLEAIDSDDPTMLIGLPLIRTSELLRQAGLDPLAVLAQTPQRSQHE